jgi:hypothetical protein
MGGYDKGYRIRNIHGDVVDSTTPFQVSEVEAKQTSSVAPTLTYTGKAAAGAVSTATLQTKPIIEDLGGRVGSFWGVSKNLVYSAFADGNPKARTEGKWMTAVVETASSATVSVYDPDKNLEELFESLTGTVKRFVARVTDKSGNTLYGWIMGVAASSDVYTFDVMNNRLTETQSWVGTLANFDNTSLEKVEIFFYNSSLAFGTGTCFTEEVECPREYSKSRKSQLEYAETLSNGQFFVDYWRGELFGVRADTTTSEVVTYNVWASTGGGTVSNPSIVQPVNYDANSGAALQYPVWSPADLNLSETFAETNLASGTTKTYYFKMGKRNHANINYKIQGTPSATLTMKVYGSNQDDGTAKESVEYSDIGQYGMNIHTAATTPASGDYVASANISTVDGSNYSWIKVTVAATVASDGDYQLDVSRWYA